MQINESELAVVNRIDEIYTEHPYYGTRRMVETLSNYGISIGRQRVSSYYKLLGLEAVYPKANLSKRNQEHKVYPYLLRYLKRKHQSLGYRVPFSVYNEIGELRC